MDFLMREARPDNAEAFVVALNPIIESDKYTVLDKSFSVEEEREFIRNFPKRGVLHVADSRTTERSSTRFLSRAFLRFRLAANPYSIGRGLIRLQSLSEDVKL